MYGEERSDEAQGFDPRPIDGWVGLGIIYFFEVQVQTVLVVIILEMAQEVSFAANEEITGLPKPTSLSTTIMIHPHRRSSTTLSADR